MIILGTGVLSTAATASGDVASGRATRHEDLDARMTAVMGPRAGTRMHELVGARWAGCADADGTGVAGPGMMNGTAGGASPASRSWWSAGSPPQRRSQRASCS